MRIEDMIRSVRSRLGWDDAYAAYAGHDLFVTWPGPYHLWKRMQAVGRETPYLYGLRSGKSLMGALVAAEETSSGAVPRFQCGLCGTIASESELEEEEKRRTGGPSFVSGRYGLLPLYTMRFGDCETGQVRRTMRE